MSHSKTGSSRNWIVRTKRFLGVALVAGVLAVGIFIGIPAFHLFSPRTPASSPALRFDGFVSLPVSPSRGLISVFDYMTVEGRSLYAASIKPGAVFRVPLRSTGLPLAADIASLDGPPSAHGVAFDPLDRSGFISRSDANVVDVFDPATLRMRKHIPVIADADGIFFDPTDHLIYVDHGDSKSATLIDAARGRVVGHVDLGGQPESAVWDPSSRRFFQNLTDIDSIVVVNPVTHSVVNQWYLEGCHGPSGVALDGLRRRLLIACKGSSKLAVFDMVRNQVIARLDIGGTPDVVGFDPILRRIYTAGRDGIMSVIQEDGSSGYHKLADVTLEFGAHTLAVDLVTHRVYVGYVSLLSPPRLAVFSVPKAD